jgi:hypothetical protein
MMCDKCGEDYNFKLQEQHCPHLALMGEYEYFIANPTGPHPGSCLCPRCDGERRVRYALIHNPPLFNLFT